MSDLPELRELDAALRQVHFEPRRSLGAEIEGRARRGEMPLGPPRRAGRFGGAAALVSLGVAALWFLIIAPRSPITVDQCCRRSRWWRRIRRWSDGDCA